MPCCSKSVAVAKSKSGAKRVRSVSSPRQVVGSSSLHEEQHRSIDNAGIASSSLAPSFGDAAAGDAGAKKNGNRTQKGKGSASPPPIFGAAASSPELRQLTVSARRAFSIRVSASDVRHIQHYYAVAGGGSAACSGAGHSVAAKAMGPPPPLQSLRIGGLPSGKGVGAGGGGGVTPPRGARPVMRGEGVDAGEVNASANTALADAITGASVCISADAGDDDPFADVMALVAASNSTARLHVKGRGGTKKAPIAAALANGSRHPHPHYQSSSSASFRPLTSAVPADRLVRIIDVPRPLLGPSELQQVYLVAMHGVFGVVRADMAAAARSPTTVANNSPTSPHLPSFAMAAPFPSSSPSSFGARSGVPTSSIAMASSSSAPPLTRKVADLIHFVNNEVLCSVDDCWYPSPSPSSPSDAGAAATAAARARARARARRGGGEADTEEHNAGDDDATCSGTHNGNSVCIAAISAADGELIGVCAATQQSAAARVEVEGAGEFKKDGCSEQQQQQGPGVTPPLPSSHTIRLSTRWVKGCLCGINLIYTSQQWKRKGLATALIDAAREALVYGYTVPREFVAFSHPTSEGRVLGASYSGREDFLVFV